MKKVNLFLVGAMKAGTTSLGKMLAQHSDIYFPPIKEPHFFVKTLPKKMYSPSRFFSLDKYFKHEFPKPLHICHIKTIQQYQQIYALSESQKYLIDCSTGYLTAPESAKSIHDYNPNAKILIITRDPLQRAYSHHTMWAGTGRETASFETAMKKELTDFENNLISPWSYLGMSLYQPHIRKYKKLFAQNVFVLSLEELKNKPNAVLENLFQFLEIKNKTLQMPKSNASRNIKSKKLQQFIYKSGLRDLAAVILPAALRQKVFQLISSPKKQPKLSTELKHKLSKIWDSTLK